MSNLNQADYTLSRTYITTLILINSPTLSILIQVSDDTRKLERLLQRVRMLRSKVLLPEDQLDVSACDSLALEIQQYSNKLSINGGLSNSSGFTNAGILAGNARKSLEHETLLCRAHVQVSTTRM